MKKVNHLFAKLVIIYCIAFASGAAVWALYKQGQGASMAEVLDIYEWIKEYVESQPTVIPPEEAGDKNNNKEG